jgi:hypothetical protein
LTLTNRPLEEFDQNLRQALEPGLKQDPSYQHTTNHIDGPTVQFRSFRLDDTRFVSANWHARLLPANLFSCPALLIRRWVTPPPSLEVLGAPADRVALVYQQAGRDGPPRRRLHPRGFPAARARRRRVPGRSPCRHSPIATDGPKDPESARGRGSRWCRGAWARPSSCGTRACPPRLVQTFEPLMTNSSPSRSACVMQLARSEPSLGSERNCTQMSSPAACGGSVASVAGACRNRRWSVRSSQGSCRTRPSGRSYSHAPRR